MPIRAAAALFIALLGAPAVAEPGPGEEAMMFEPRSGEPVEAYRGAFEVPENRSNPDSRMLSLGYVRFPATTDAPGAPIVYLAGGPGGSGSATAQGRRFPLFMALRAQADVIAFDQRGTGFSDQAADCTSDIVIALEERQTDAELAALQRAAAETCLSFWEAEGVDIRGYTTLESVADLSALREHLGAETISLWGISYGSHLALAAIDAMPDELDRVMLASAEGLDQTVKLPSRTNAYVDRLNAAVQTQPEAAAAYGDVPALLRRVQARFDEEPVRIALPLNDGSTAPMLLQRHHLQQAVSGLIADPASAAMLLQLYADLDRGETEMAAGLFARFAAPGQPIRLNPMSFGMDIASGISAERQARFDAEAGDGLAGAYLNFPMPQLAGFAGLDLGPEFRDGPSGGTPVLLFSGTLDGRTYVEGQQEAVAGLANVTTITVVNAGHNLFMSSPVVAEEMLRFLRAEPPGTREIVVPLPDFAPR